MATDSPYGYKKGFSQIPTFRWDGEKGEWIEWKGNPDPLRISSLSALSWNVLRTDAFQSDFLHELRIPALLRQVKAISPDIIAFQEVTPPFLEMLLRQVWIRKAYFLAGPPSMLKGQKLRELFLSKYPPERSVQLHWSDAKRPSGMEWTINGRLFSSLSLHLPSDFSNNPAEKRRKYLGELHLAIPENSAALLLGDFNLRGRAELPNAYQDIWTNLRPQDPGYTFHPQKNPLAGAIARHGRPSRLDRIYLKAPSGHVIPQDIALLGDHPSERHGHTVWASDHFGLHAELTMEVTYQSLAAAPVGHRTALAFVPAPSAWRDIQYLRRGHDDRFQRWMPHVNLLFGFIPETHFPAAAAAIRMALAELPPFRLRFEDIGQFDHKDSTTLWLKPDAESGEKLQELRAMLKAIFPQCRQQDRYGDFIPHLTVGKFPGRHRAYASAKRLQWRQHWEDLEVEVGSLCLLAREGDEPFRVSEVVRLDEEGEDGFAVEAWDLETALGALGLAPGPFQKALSSYLEKQIRSAVRKADSKCQFHSTGLAGLGCLLPGADLEYLGLGRLGPEAFRDALVEALGNVPVTGEVAVDFALLHFKLDEREIHFRYVQVPKGIEIRRPSSFNNRDFSLLSPQVRELLVLSLETAALRRILGPHLPVFQQTAIALQSWLGPSAAPDIRVWILLLAAAPFEESPDRWLENALQMVLQHDFSLPISPLSDFSPTTPPAPMQVLTPTFPQVNVAAHITEEGKEKFLDVVESALESVWRIRQRQSHWLAFLQPLL